VCGPTASVSVVEAGAVVYTSMYLSIHLSSFFYGMQTIYLASSSAVKSSTFQSLATREAKRYATVENVNNLEQCEKLRSPSRPPGRRSALLIRVFQIQSKRAALGDLTNLTCRLVI